MFSLIAVGTDHPSKRMRVTSPTPLPALPFPTPASASSSSSSTSSSSSAAANSSAAASSSSAASSSAAPSSSSASSSSSQSTLVTAEEEEALQLTALHEEECEDTAPDAMRPNWSTTTADNDSELLESVAPAHRDMLKRVLNRVRDQNQRLTRVVCGFDRF